MSRGWGGDFVEGATQRAETPGFADRASRELAESVWDAVDAEIVPELEEALAELFAEVEVDADRAIDEIEEDVEEWLHELVEGSLSRAVGTMVEERLEDAGALARDEIARLRTPLATLLADVITDAGSSIERGAEAAVAAGLDRLTVELRSGDLRRVLEETADTLATRGVRAADAAAQETGVFQDARLLGTAGVSGLLVIGLGLTLRQTRRDRHHAHTVLDAVTRAVEDYSNPQIKDAISKRTTRMGVEPWLSKFLGERGM